MAFQFNNPRPKMPSMLDQTTPDAPVFPYQPVAPAGAMALGGPMASPDAPIIPTDDDTPTKRSWAGPLSATISGGDVNAALAQRGWGPDPGKKLMSKFNL